MMIFGNDTMSLRHTEEKNSGRCKSIIRRSASQLSKSTKRVTCISSEICRVIQLCQERRAFQASVQKFHTDSVRMYLQMVLEKFV